MRVRRPAEPLRDVEKEENVSLCSQCQLGSLCYHSVDMGRYSDVNMAARAYMVLWEVQSREVQPTEGSDLWRERRRSRTVESITL